MAHSHAASRSLHKNIIAYNGRRSDALEEYRVIRSNIQFLDNERGARSLVVTAPESGAGSTTTAVNLAISMTLRGDRVLLIDANLRKPVLHNILRVSNHSGLTTVLAGRVDLDKAIQQTGIGGLEVLTCGPVHPYMDELLGSAEMDILLTEAKQRYDSVLLDCPAVLSATDTALLANRADSVILVIEGGKTSKDAAVKAQRMLARANAELLGVVLNHKK